MASAEVMKLKKPGRLKLSKTSAVSNAAHGKILSNLRKIAFTRYDELVSFLSDRNPDDFKKKAADEIINTPGAAEALEKIMLEDESFDLAAAAFISLLRHKDDVELTEKQNVLFKLILRYHDDLAKDLDEMGIRGGSVLMDILFNGKTEYSRLSAAYMLSRAEVSDDDMRKILVHMGELENEHIKNQLFKACAGSMYLVR